MGRTRPRITAVPIEHTAAAPQNLLLPFPVRVDACNTIEIGANEQPNRCRARPFGHLPVAVPASGLNGGIPGFARSWILYFYYIFVLGHNFRSRSGGSGVALSIPGPNCICWVICSERNQLSEVAGDSPGDLDLVGGAAGEV